LKFIVEPRLEEKQYGNGAGGPDRPPLCLLFVTMCALCSEDERFCDPR